MKNIRWGILSTANINRRVIPAIRASRRGELVAVAGRDGERTRAYAAQWEIPQAFTGYQAMLQSDAVDAVYISLPNHLHAEWTIRALQAGKHVLCEKPFALTTAEVDAMTAAARASGCTLAEAFMYRHHPQTLKIGEVLRSGDLGDLSLVRAYFSFVMGAKQRLGNVRLSPEKGGGALWDVGIYPVSFAQYVMSQVMPESPAAPVLAQGVSRLGDSGVDEDFAGMLTYAGGAAAQVGCSFRVPHTMDAQIYGSQGRLDVLRPFTGLDQADAALIFTPNEGEPRRLDFARTELYLGEVEDLHAAVLDGKPNVVTLEESRLHVATAQALYRSAAQGMPVPVTD